MPTARADAGERPDRQKVRAEGLALSVLRQNEGPFFPNYQSGGMRWPGRCELPTDPEDERVSWWFTGIPKTDLLPVVGTSDDRDVRAGIVGVEGGLIEEAGHGPDGRREGRLDVAHHTVDACETFEAFGSCVAPRPGDRCVRGTESGFETEPTFRLSRGWAHPGGIEPGYVYSLRAWNGRQVADGGWELELTFHDRPSGPTERQRLSGRVAGFTVEQTTFFGEFECEFDADHVRGWTRRHLRKGHPFSTFAVSAEATKLASREGEPDARASRVCRKLVPFHVWGRFRVEGRGDE
ncbi:MAG: hypothetical protein ABEL76_01570 [Bradymonadaceae bacterium]